MKKLIILFLSLALCLTLTSALADAGITVNGSGECLVAADTAVITLGVNIRKPSAPEAQSEANAVIASIREKLTGAGFSEEDITTGYINLYAVYDYTKEVEEIVAYSANSTLAVRVTDMDRAGEVIDLAFSAGANTLDGVTFSVSDDSAARAEALKAAFTDAQEKAAVLAEVSGQQIQLLSIQEGTVYSYDSGMNTFSKNAGAEMDLSAPTVVRAAKICVSATLTVTYAIVH